jgi:hypothetical protein
MDFGFFLFLYGWLLPTLLQLWCIMAAWFGWVLLLECIAHRATSTAQPKEDSEHAVNEGVTMASSLFAKSVEDDDDDRGDTHFVVIKRMPKIYGEMPQAMMALYDRPLAVSAQLAQNIERLLTALEAPR